MDSVAAGWDLEPGPGAWTWERYPECGVWTAFLHSIVPFKVRAEGLKVKHVLFERPAGCGLAACLVPCFTGPGRTNLNQCRAQ